MSPGRMATRPCSAASSRSSAVTSWSLGEPLEPLGRAHVEQHAPPGEVPDVLDPEHGGSARRVDRGDRHPVVEGVVVAHVGQAVPVGGGLQGHGHDVVGEVRDHALAVGVAEVGAVDLHHGVQRVDPPVHLADLHAVGVLEVQRARHPPPGPHQRGGVGDGFVGDQVEGAEAVVVAPAPPVADLVAQGEEGVSEAHGVSRWARAGCQPPCRSRAHRPVLSVRTARSGY